MASLHPDFKSLVTLVPRSGLQFLDFGFALESAARINRVFHEERDGPGEDAAVVLHQVETADGAFLHPLTGVEVPVDETFVINAQKALDPFLGRWLPLPYLRLRGEDARGLRLFDVGPTNWARLHVTALPERDADGNAFHVVLAFDTALARGEQAGDGPYTTPTVEHAAVEQIFALAADPAEAAGFVNEPWIEEWLEDAFLDHLRAKRAGKPLRPDDTPHRFEHVARYLTFLSLIRDTVRLPSVKLIDTVSKERSYTPISVDLVLDIGNSRTCGILIEGDPDKNRRLDLAQSHVLRLRDLSEPSRSYAQPVDSRVEFCRASFGKDAISRRSGRADAFQWPSLVRVGPEAVRLSGQASGTEGPTGISSPKRYLWDRRPLNQVWRGTRTGSGASPPVSGPLLAFLTEDGDVIRQLRKPAPSAIRPKFSRSSLYSFLMAEVLLQAIAGINAPVSRMRQTNADVPRELRRIIMTIPPATPLAERRILRERVEGAVKLLWQAMGWLDAEAGGPAEPRVQIAFDEATCTQMVYLYSEITQKFKAAAADFFAIVGRKRNGPRAAPSLRIASIDIGGGTTDLMVITYRLEGRRALTPTQNFREGFNIAGDDVLEAVVARHVLSGIETALAEAGVADARAFLRGLVGGDRGGQSEQERQMRRRFVSQVIMPAALGMMRAYEDTDTASEDASETRPLLKWLSGYGALDAATLAGIEATMRQAGAPGFDLLAAPLTMARDEFAATVRSVIGPVLNDLCEVIHRMNCDIVLLSGRPSRLPVVRDLLYARVPVRPDRIVPMHRYRAGRWYPFRDAFDRIDDPKTTVAVGALIASLADSQIEGFSVMTGQLKISSTARFIGELELNGHIEDAGILFSDIDLEAKPGTTASRAVLEMRAPAAIGFRQLPLERWPATPLYVLEFANPSAVARMSPPLFVTLERAEPDDEDESRKEDFRVAEVVDNDGASLRPGDVVLRLQTMRSAGGYWLDTGVVGPY